MNQNILKRLLEINNKFYEENSLEFSITRSSKNFWIVYDECFKKNQKKYMINDNRVFVYGNLDNDFNNYETIKILDVGCGEGRFYRYLKETSGKNFSYLGIDNSKKLITSALTKTPEINIKYLDITNINELSKLDDDYDLIVSFSVFHHIPSKELRANILNVLSGKIKNTGKLIITTWDFKNRFKDKIVDCKKVGINKIDLDSNDYILNWKNNSYRYVCDVSQI